MFRKRFKKIAALFCLVVILLVNVFSFSASANVVSAGSGRSYRTIGAPVQLDFYQIFYYEDSSTDIFFGAINRPNVYYYRSDGTPDWFEGYRPENSPSVNQLFRLGYNPYSDAYADVYLEFQHYTNVSSVKLDSSILFTSWNDLDSNFNVHFGVKDAVDALGSSLNTFIVTYTYTFLVRGVNSDGVVIMYPETVTGDVLLSAYGYSYADVPLFNSNVLTNVVIQDYKTFDGTGYSGERYCYLESASVQLNGVFAKQYYIEPSSVSANRLFSDYQDLLSSRYMDIYYDPSYTETTVFEGISWTGWLINALSGFLDFEIVPGLSFAGMLGLLIGMSLFVIFLKIFAGG